MLERSDWLEGSRDEGKGNVRGAWTNDRTQAELSLSHSPPFCFFPLESLHFLLISCHSGLFWLLLASCTSLSTKTKAKPQKKKEKKKITWKVGGMIGPLVLRTLYNNILTIEPYLPSVPVGHITSFEIDMQRILLRALIDPRV